MGHRNLSNSFPIFEIEQDQNRSHITSEQTYIHIGTAVAPESVPFVHPTDNIMPGGLYHAPQMNLETRQHFQSSVSGPSYDGILPPETSRSFFLPPENNAVDVHCSSRIQHPNLEFKGNFLDFTMGSDRALFKRKSPENFVPREEGSAGRFYCAGSSSSSSEEKQTSDYLNNSSSFIGISNYRSGGLSIGSEDSWRNVRSRSGVDLRPNPIRNDCATYSYHQYSSTNTHRVNHSGTMDFTNPNSHAACQDWVHVSAVSNGRIVNSDMNGPSHERNQIVVGESAIDTEGYHRNSIPSRHHISPSQYVHARAERETHSNHFRRTVPSSYRAHLAYPHLVHDEFTSENGIRFLPEAYSSRYQSRPSSNGGWQSTHRNGRPRIAFDRFHPHSNTGHANGNANEAVMMVDGHSSLYGSRNLFDQYRDMRLDVDNMSYEELLDLGERIGSVSTGLSEEMIAKCLTKTLYDHASDHSDEEGTCIICLEGYKTKEEVGTVMNCGHDYHVGCIKKWLALKNACPICKAPALSDS